MEIRSKFAFIDRAKAMGTRELSHVGTLLPGQLEQRLAEFVDYYNLRRSHVYFGRGQTILTRRENIKLKSIELRRRLHHQSAATTSTQM